MYYLLSLVGVLLLSGADYCPKTVPVLLASWLHLAQSSVGNHTLLVGFVVLLLFGLVDCFGGMDLTGTANALVFPKTSALQNMGISPEPLSSPKSLFPLDFMNYLVSWSFQLSNDFSI